MDSSKYSIITSVMWKFAERVLAQAVSLVVSIVLARIISLEHFGSIAMVLVFITIANVFVTEGIPAALIQKKDADDLDFSSVFWVNLVISIVLYIVIFFSSGFIASFYEEEILSPVLKVLGFRIIVAAINSVQHSFVSRHMMFRKYFWSTLSGTILSGVVGIFLAYKGLGIWALVAQYMVNTTVDTIVLFFTVNWRPQFIFSIKRVFELLKFGWKIFYEGLANVIAGQIRNLIIGKVYTSNDLAYYTKGQQFPNLIVTNISTAIGAVLFPAMSNKQDNKSDVLLILRKSIRVSSYVIFPMIFGLAAVASPLTTCLLTEKWIEVVPFIQFFCLTSLATVGMIPRHQAINSIGRSDVFMNEHIIARIVSIALLFAVYKISVFAIVISGLGGTVILSLIVAYTSRKYNGYSYRDQLADIVPILIGCIIMAIPVFLLKYLPIPTIAILIIQILLGVTIYIAYSLIFNLEGLLICKQYFMMIYRRIKRSR